MRVVQVIMILALLLAAPAACWADTTVRQSVASSYFVTNPCPIEYTQDLPYAGGDQFVQQDKGTMRIGYGWHSDYAVTFGPYYTYLQFPRVQAPTGSVLVSCLLFVNYDPRPDLYENDIQCRGVVGYDLDFSAITYNSMPPGNTVPAAVVARSYGTWFDVTPLLNYGTSDVLMLELSAGWTLEEQYMLDNRGDHGGECWGVEIPHPATGGGSAPAEPRLVFTFDQPGIKRTQVSVGALKAGYGGE